MKKILFFIIILLFGLTPLITKAETAIPSFFDAMEKMGDLQDYKSVQSIYGDISIDDGEDMKLKGEFKLSSRDMVKNTGEWKSDQHSKINAFLKLAYLGKNNENKPFDNLMMEVRGEVITLSGQVLYFKLDHINIKADGVSESDLEAMETGMEGIKQMKGSWYKMDIQSVQEEAMPSEYSDIADVEQITSDLESKGLEETVKDLADSIIPQIAEESGMTDEDVDQIQTFINRVFETEFFTVKEATAGENTGFTLYHLNRSAITEMILDLAEQFGESLGMEEINQLRSYLNKVSISGKYLYDTDYDIFEKFFMNFKLRNIDALKKLNMNYRYSISDINEGLEITEPAEYLEFDTSGFIPEMEEPVIDETGLEE